MFDLITRDYKGSTITVGITGVPTLITGEVFDGTGNIIGLRLAGGNKVFINAGLIAFFF